MTHKHHQSMLLISKACCKFNTYFIDNSMFNRLAKLEKGQGRFNIDFIYTHPTGETRIKVRKGLDAHIPIPY